ncbi:hypothetical protein [Microbispora bryophytorum]|uniref:Nickel uptake substrate-specific transmembrane region n=1 Tax=Microbispora bryophytorum subsp. camponoti TaxID=1677852 RepID=A0ABR8L7E8_9ACTN|nr:hypothetical protein [Microbispora camponoti]MBD3145917.1 hypothetical protein [Microbispora camponoti]
MTIIHHLLARLLRRPRGDGAPTKIEPVETESVEIESVEVDPDPVPIGGEDQVVATFEVVTSGPSAEVTGELVAPDESRAELRFEREERTAFEERWRSRHAFGRDAAAGTWRVVVGAGNGTEEREFEVRAEERLRRSRIDSFELSPDPVDEGSPLTVSGLLEVVTGKEDWGGLPGRTVALLFRPDDMLARREVARVVTDRSGRFDATVTATESGFWSAEFRGDARDFREDGDFKEVRAVRDAGRVTAARSAEVHSAVSAAGAQTKITYSANPKSGRPNRKATHAGTLFVRVQPAGQPARWDPLPQQRVRLWFDPSGTGADAVKGTATTGSDGRFTLRKKVPSAGEWQVRFDSQAPSQRRSCKSPVRRLTVS